jgi:HPt (histidine-containing phosphotransfer) domain-containing protein
MLKQSFFDEAPKLVASLRKAEDENDAQLARRAAHTLKASARDFGATRLSEICKNLEDKAQNNDISDLKRQTDEIENEYNLAHNALRAKS